MQSLGRVGRILSGSLDPASMSVPKDSQQGQKEAPSSRQESPTAVLAESPSSQTLQSLNEKHKEDNQSQGSKGSNYSLTMRPHTMLQEPDVIASTKLAPSKTTDSVSSRIALKNMYLFYSFYLSILDHFSWIWSSGGSSATS